MFTYIGGALEPFARAAATSPIGSPQKPNIYDNNTNDNNNINNKNNIHNDNTISQIDSSNINITNTSCHHRGYCCYYHVLARPAQTRRLGRREPMRPALATCKTLQPDDWFFRPPIPKT